MNKLAKELGIELKPFCTRAAGLTDQIAQDILDRCVDLGAELYEKVRRFKYDGCIISDWRFLGIDNYNNSTFFCDYTNPYDHNELTYHEMLEYLQLHEEGGRLVPNEATTECNEPLRLTLEEITGNLAAYSFLNEREVRDYLDYVYKLEGSKKERLDNEIRELENTLKQLKDEREEMNNG